MDINMMRVAVTVFSLLLFLGIVAWAWARRREPDFEAAARLPFSDDPGAETAPEAIAMVGGGQR